MIPCVRGNSKESSSDAASLKKPLKDNQHWRAALGHVHTMILLKKAKEIFERYVCSLLLGLVGRSELYPRYLVVPRSVGSKSGSEALFPNNDDMPEFKEWNGVWKDKDLAPGRSLFFEDGSGS